MEFLTLGNPKNPAILFFHALGVNGKSNTFVANYMKDDYFIIMPTYTAFCTDGVYQSKKDEIEQIKQYIKKRNISELELVIASSIGADLAMEFIKQEPIKMNHVFVDGGQFAQISKAVRRIMTPFLYFAMRSIYKSNGKTLKKIFWCDDESIKPFFIEAGKNLDYQSMKNMMKTSLTEEPFPQISKEMQEKIIFEFGEIEDHFKYRSAVKLAYPHSSFPIFPHKNHMEFQIREPERFSEMLYYIMKHGEMPKNIEIQY